MCACLYTFLGRIPAFTLKNEWPSVRSVRIGLPKGLVYQKHEPVEGEWGQATVLKIKLICVASKRESDERDRITSAQARLNFRVNGIAAINL